MDWNFYEFIELLEQDETLAEGQFDQTGSPSQYGGSANPHRNDRAADGYGTRKDLPDVGSKLSKAAANQAWQQAVAANPALGIYNKMRDSNRADKLADRQAQAQVGDQEVIRKGGGVSDVIRTGKHDIAMKLQADQSPQGVTALKLHNILFKPEFFGKQIPVNKILPILMNKTKLNQQAVAAGLKHLAQTATGRLEISQGEDGMMLHVVNPFELGAPGSAQEAPGADAEDANLTAAARGGQFQTPETPASKVATGGPQEMPKGGLQAEFERQWPKMQGVLNQALMGNKQAVEAADGIIAKMKSVLGKAEGEKWADHYKTELSGFEKDLGTVAQEQYDLYEAMCNIGV